MRATQPVEVEKKVESEAAAGIPETTQLTFQPPQIAQAEEPVCLQLKPVDLRRSEFEAYI